MHRFWGLTTSLKSYTKLLCTDSEVWLHPSKLHTVAAHRFWSQNDFSLLNRQSKVRPYQKQLPQVAAQRFWGQTRWTHTGCSNPGDQTCGAPEPMRGRNTGQTAASQTPASTGQKEYRLSGVTGTLKLKCCYLFPLTFSAATTCLWPDPHPLSTHPPTHPHSECFHTTGKRLQNSHWLYTIHFSG